MEKEKERKLALFDLDGTLTRKDTFLELIKYFFGRRRFRMGLLRLSPCLLRYQLRLIPNWEAKEKVLMYFFKDITLDQFQKKCNEFAIEKLPSLLKEKAWSELKKLKRDGARIVIVSASAENWIRPWCNLNDIECIATRLEVREGKLTGRIKGRNCYGVEKVNRIREQIDLSQYNEILAYGDSKGDLPMLELAAKAYYKPF